MSRYTSATDADRREMLAAIGVDSIEELFADIPASLRLEPAAGARPRAAPSRRSTTSCARWPRATSAPRTRSRSSGAGMYDHYVPALVDSIISARSS